MSMVEARVAAALAAEEEAVEQSRHSLRMRARDERATIVARARAAALDEAKEAGRQRVHEALEKLKTQLRDEIFSSRQAAKAQACRRDSRGDHGGNGLFGVDVMIGSA